MSKPNCYECTHRGKVAGSAHSCCKNGGSAIRLGIEGHPHGIKKGWFMWPVDFDPVWLEECNGFLKREEK